jgi:hypothetical protein
MKCLTTRTRALSLLLSFVALLVVNVHAQDLDDVTINGQVTDQTGALVVGTTVTAVLTATNAARNCMTDAEGRYRLIELAPGTYTVSVTSPGFAREERKGLATVAGQNVRLDFVLRPAGVTAEQTIVSETDAGAVDTTRTVVGNTVTREEAEALPVATRAPLDLIFTLPGVTEEPLSVRDLAEDRNRSARSTPEEAGTFALAGGAAYSNNLTIDGLDNNDDRAARERFQPSLEAVAEVQVITNQFSAEYGRASGGRINLRTRAGTKDLHGRLFYFFRDEALNANSFFNNARGLKRLPLQQHNPGFTLAGPVALRKLFGANDARVHHPRSFFFLAYEYNTLLDTTLIDTLVPVEPNPRFQLPAPTTLAGRRFEAADAATGQPAELAPYVKPINTPLREHTLSARLDHNFTDTHNGSLLLQLGRSKNLRQFGGGARLADALQGRTRDTDALAYSDNFVFSPRVVNQLRAQASRLTPATKPRADEARPVVLITLDDPLPASDPANRAGTLVAGSSTAGASDRREVRWQLQDALTVVTGAHSFKFGGDLQRVRSTFIDLTDATGTYNFTSAADFLANAPSRFRQNFNTESTQRNLYAAVFAQDEWRVRPNLMLSAGLRYERETILHDHNNFAPRLAVAYDPFGTGKTVVRLGAGVFFNRALLRTIDDFTLGTARVLFDTNALNDEATGRALTDEQRRAFIAAHLNFPQPLAADSPIVRQFGTVETNFTRRLDTALRLPESYQANVGVERDLGHGFVFEANYTYNRTAHLWREFNVNAPRLPRGYRDFTSYLLARDFANFRDTTGTRPLYNVASAGELVRFTLAPPGANDPNTISRVIEFGVPVTIFNLNSVNSTTALNAALAALNELRPDPARTEVEQLISAGNSFYHGLTLEARRRFGRVKGGLAFSLRAAYTLSRLTDDGIVNTSDAVRPGDFRGERARSLLDRRQRFVLSGVLDLPPALLRLRLAPVLRLASGAPFNLSLGVDRNLDDVGNDRPIFNGDPHLLRARQANEPLNPALVAALTLPIIGQTGNLPRNAGLGPKLFLFDLNVTREFRLSERARLRPTVEFDNLLNKTVFTFGAEFINFNALRPDASAEQRQAFLDTFLVPTRTLRPRSVRLGLRFDF